VRLEASERELHLQVDDNGHGFIQAPSDKPEGLGLKIMRYRAQMLGGDLTTSLTVEGGASVRCSFIVEAGRDDIPRA